MKLSLKHLILAVAMLAVALTLFGSIYSGYRTNEQNLIENGLETNRVYAQKLASTTDLFFRTALQTLEQSAKALTPWMEAGASEQQLLAEAERLRLQTNTLNSVVIVSADGTIVQNSPQNLELIGKKLDSQGGKQALLERKPLISEPYMAITGRLIIFISYPIFDEQGQYLGLVGGSLYLREDNFLNELLGEHFYHDGSYVYVVDAKGHIIYHQDLLRVNDDVSSNQVVQKLMNGQSGAERVSNTEHVDMLAGYAYVPTLGWGIVSQRPTAMALEANRKMIDQMLLNALPILLVSIAVIFFISNLIARPLQRLAVLTESSTKSNEHDRFNKVKAWYYEATQLKRALTFSLGFLHDKVDHITQESNTDPLTKLTNRRTMDRLINQWLLERQMFALVVVDIDHFKQVNDTYGHAVGDKVLVYLAERMKAAAGEQALCCRYGGEEFVILLPNHNRSKAFQIAERLRMLVCETDSPSGDIITISAGIADSSERGQADKLFQLADQRLYKAKHDGRNRSNAG